MQDNGNVSTESPFEVAWEDEKGKIGTYAFRALMLYEEAPFNRIIERNAKTPIDMVAPLLERLPELERKELWKQARDQQGRWCPPSFADSEGHAILLRTHEARVEFLEAAFRRAKPTIPDEEMERLKKAVTRYDLAVIYKLLVGITVPSDAGDPKAGVEQEAQQESEEEAAQRLEKEKEARLLMQSLQESWERAVSPFRWITTP